MTTIVAHQNQIQQLQAWQVSGQLPQVLLFQGPRGVGKATLAQQFIADVVGPATYNIIRLAPEEEGGIIKIEQVRQVLNELSLTPFDDTRPRFVVIDAVDDLNRQAANALLKTLEEPPARTHFILLNHQSGRLLPTIRSRAQLVPFKTLQPADLRQVAGAMGHSDIPDVVIQMAQGSVRQALTLIALGGAEFVMCLQQALAKSDLAALHPLAEQILAQAKSFDAAKALAFALRAEWLVQQKEIPGRQVQGWLKAIRFTHKSAPVNLDPVYTVAYILAEKAA